VFKAKPIERNQEGQKITQENDDGSIEQIESRRAQNIEQAIRCLRVSPDGSMIACGDWYGNIRIHDLNSEKLDEIHCIEAHENEILSLDFALKNEIKGSIMLTPEQS
jgi:WD40 repeat protein